MLHLGDCLEVMKSMPDNSVDLVLTDPPYGIFFMSRKWDCEVPSVEVWAEALRVLKPGGHLLAFAGTRTQHRMACRIEDAGFEIRDMLAWVYGSGMPKSHNGPWGGTALKPALEPITMARKPLIGTVAANVLEHGTGALNIDECRVGTENIVTIGSAKKGTSTYGDYAGMEPTPHTGRWPANLLHDGSDEVVEMFPQTKSRKQEHPLGTGGMFSDVSNRPCAPQYGDSGSAARFFASFPLDRAAEDSDLEQEINCRIKYCAKASKVERDSGCEAIEKRAAGALNMRTDAHSIANDMNTAPRSNHHPTVKPIALMEYLVKLASREGQIVLDPFMGSGTTGIACAKLGRNFIGIEREPEYFKIAEARIDNATSLF